MNEGSAIRTPLQGLLPEDLTALCKAEGFPAFRAKQLWQWLQVQRVTAWEDMQNLPKDFREKIGAAYTPCPLQKIQSSGLDGGTRKLLFRLQDGEHVETVLLPGNGRLTVCVSCQVGCKMGCAFCASAKGGFARSLQAGEIVAQVLAAATETGTRPDHIVYMGMGEPFDNYDEVLRAIRVINHPEGLSIGARKQTLSTCGIIPGMERLAGEGLQVELSISLHAPNAEIRRRLMPIERKYPFDDLLRACADYTRRTKRIITFEYTLIHGVNDAPEDAAELAGHLRRFPSRVNLIPLSPVAEFEGEAPPPRAAERFLQMLERRGVNATLRRSRGKKVDAACGQLRRRLAETKQ